jgi:Ca-activated chloride channel family protein
MVDSGELARHAAQLRSRGVTTTTLGFGQGFDERLLSAMSEAGGGNFEYIQTPDRLVPFFTRELGDMLNAAAIGLTLHITLPGGVRGEVISVLPANRHGKTFKVSVGDLPAGESIDILMHLTARPGTRGERLPVQIAAEWSDPASERDAQWSGEPAPLQRESNALVRTLAADPEVAEKAALLRAARAQREALRLDRAGRFEESRRQMYDIVDYLRAAPQSDRVRQEMELVDRMASAPVTAHYDETTHKRTASRASRMGRGRRDRDETLTDQ